MKKNKTRFLALVLALTILAGLLPTTVLAGSADPAAEKPTFCVSSATACTGGTVCLTVSIQNNPGIVYAGLNISYDHTKLTLTGVTDGKLLDSPTFGPTANVPFVMTWDESTAAANNTKNGVLATLNFRIADGCAAGDVPVTLSYTANNVYNHDLDNVAFEIQSGKVTVQAHRYGAPVYAWSTDNSTCTATRTCTVDSKTETETANAAAAVTAPTCTAAGKTVYTAAFTNAAFEQQKKEVPIPATGHSWGTVSYSWNSDYTACTASRSCTVDGIKETETAAAVRTANPAAGTTVCTATFQNSAFAAQTCTVTAAGTAPAFLLSSASGKPGSTVSITLSMQNNPGIVYAGLNISYDHTKLTLTGVTDAQLLGDPTFSDSYTAIPYTLTWDESTAAANNTKNGVLATLSFRIADGCAAGDVPITLSYTAGNVLNHDLDSVAFTALNGKVTVTEHTFGSVVYTWNADCSKCTASRTCTDGDGYVESETVSSVSAVTQPTCTAAGKTVYTAVFTNPAFAQQQKEVTIPATGHSWGTVSYTWSSDDTTCTATRTCTVDGAADTQTVKAAAAVTAPTCTAHGKTVYTAAFTNPAFTQQQKESAIPATGHSYLVTGGDTPEIKYVCQNCGDTYTHPVTDTTPVFTVSDASGYAGSQITVTVSMAKNPGIVNLNLNLTYDSSKLKLLSVSDGGLLANPLHNSQQAGRCVLSWEDSLAAENHTGNGTLATLTFLILSSGAGKTPVSLSYAPNNILNTGLDDVEFAIENGEVTILQKAPVNPSTPGSTSDSIRVTFRLVGDSVHDGGTSGHSAYVTWIPTVSYTLKSGSTVCDLFTKALGDAGLKSAGATSGFVDAIWAPDVFGGYSLSSGSNGKNSGWMYTVNGKYPNVTLLDYKLSDGDTVIWHYVDDYKTEESKNVWTTAADISPAEYCARQIASILTVGKHGSASPALKYADLGTTVTFTFTPDKGYKVKDVKVDGKSVGAVETYTYKNLSVSSRVEVEFVSETWENPFTDVQENDWFFDDVAYVSENGLFDGLGGSKFGPYQPMTRAMLVTVLYRLEGEPSAAGSSSYRDVYANQWYSDAIAWATGNQIVNGYGNGRFGPNDHVTREQLTAILYRYAQYKNCDTGVSGSLNGYADAKNVSAWAVSAMRWAIGWGLVNGQSGKILPRSNANRAQVAAILRRFCDKVSAF
jgi:hypothetical protein